MKAKGIIVSSVKGGTGKSLYAYNLAKRCSERGKTGLIDADIDSSNFSEFVNAKENIQINSDKKTFIPYHWNDVDVFSMSLLADREKAVSMEGSRITQVLKDAVESTEWSPNMEYLIFDLPRLSLNLG